MTLTWFDIGVVLFCGIIVGFLYAFQDRKYQRTKNYFWKEIIDCFPMAFFFQPRKKGLPFCSKNLVLSLTLTHHNTTWKDLIAHFDSADAEGLNSAYQNLQEKKTPFDMYAHSANRLFSFQVSGKCLKNGDFLVTFQDISELEKQNLQCEQRLKEQESMKDLLVSALENLSFPLFIRDQTGQNIFANSAVTQNAKSLNDMDWLSSPFESNQHFFTMTYGQETKTEEELKIILNKMTAAHRRLCQELPCPVCLFSARGELIACSKSFAELWHLNQAWLKSNPSFEEYWDTIQEQGLLSRVADFAGYKKQQRESFARLSETSELFLYLPDGRLIRRLMIPYAQGSVILLDEISENVKK